MTQDETGSTAARQIAASLRLLLPLAFLAPLAGQAAAADCNFDVAVGNCQAVVKILRSSGSPPSYAAELEVSSSAPRCSRVDYFIDSTPYQTVLRNKRSDLESVFGPKPITASNVKVAGCTSFATAASKTDRPAKTDADPAGGFAGHWTGSVQWLFVSDQTDVTISVNGSSASGVWRSGKGGSTVSFSGRVSGNVLQFDYVAPGDGSHGTATMTLNGRGSAAITFAAAPATFSGTLTRQ